MWSNTRLKDVNEVRDASPSSSRFAALGGSVARNRNQPLDCKVCKVVSDVPWWLGRAWHNLLALSGAAGDGHRVSGEAETRSRLARRRLTPLVVVVALLLAGAWWRSEGAGLGLDLGGVDMSRWRSMLGDSERLLWLEKSMSQLKELLMAGRHREHSHDVSHGALVADVRRLKEAVESVQRDVRRLLGLDDDARGPGTPADRVRQEHQSLLLRPHGDQLAPAGSSPGLLPFPGGDSSQLSHWLQQRYVSRDELKAALGALKLGGDRTEGRRSGSGSSSSPVTEEQVELMVKSALRLFSEDRVGMADYALESAGGAVLRTHSSVWSLFCVPPSADCSSSSNQNGRFVTKPPRVVLQPDNQPGNCWGFAGSQGKLVIRLSMRVRPTFFTLEHVARSLAPAGSIRSAPRDFSVYGLDDDDAAAEESGGGTGGTLLGSYTYDQDGDALQTFSEDQNNHKVFSLIEVNVLSNWGHPDYTCMYRFRVHGNPVL